MDEKLERLWNREYCKAMAGNFMLFFSFYLLTPLLPIYLDSQFKADKDMIGLVLSGYVVAALIIRPFSGFIVDSFNRKKVLMLCFFTFFICFTGYIGAGTLLMFAIVQQYGGYRRITLLATQRRHRLLWTEQQSGHGDSTFGGHMDIWCHR